MVQAALLAAPDHCAASHHSGLLLYGIEVGEDLTPHLPTLNPEPIRIRGITTHRLTTMSIRIVDRWRLLSPELCLSTAATKLSLADVVALAVRMTSPTSKARESAPLPGPCPGRCTHFLQRSVRARTFCDPAIGQSRS